MNNKYLFIIVIILVVIASVSSSKKRTTSFNNAEEKVKENIIVKVKNKDNTINNIELEKYVVGVVAGEMPASFNDEALKAQAIASRTYAVYKMNTSKGDYDLVTDVSNQVYISKKEMQEKWGSDYNKYIEKVTNVVNDTKDLVMTYNGEVIESFYFAISNGKTENVTSVFNEERDYLKSVESSDTNVNNFMKTITISRSEFCNKLSINCDNIVIKDIKYNETGRIDELNINNKVFKGTEIRRLLSLRSTDFKINIGDNISITTKGYGHGVGMSQYGANEMAKNGSSYEEILKHYYQNIDIVKNNV